MKLTDEQIKALWPGDDYGETHELAIVGHGRAIESAVLALAAHPAAPSAAPSVQPQPATQQATAESLLRELVEASSALTAYRSADGIVAYRSVSARMIAAAQAAQDYVFTRGLGADCPSRERLDAAIDAAMEG